VVAPFRTLWVFLACLVGSIASASGQDIVGGYAPRMFVGSDGSTMAYRIFVPDGTSRTKPLPVVVYLHGGGGIGTDNLRQISGGNTPGTSVWVTPEAQARHPTFVIAPQLPTRGDRWDRRETDDLAPFAELVVELLDSLSREFAIDRDRMYLTGQSLGGFGTWDIITKRPGLFAAAVPVCGEGTPSRAASARDVPIWAFHGARDEAVPVSGSREMVAALRASGSAVKYTEYPDVGHDVWLRAYAEPGLPDWLFAQRGHGQGSTR
jgi:predicted peptidase